MPSAGAGYPDDGLGNGAVLTSPLPSTHLASSASSRSPSSRERTSGLGPVGRSIVLAGRGRTLIGHQNQRPSSAAMDGVMNDLTIRVSNKRPSPMGVPTCPMI